MIKKFRQFLKEMPYLFQPGAVPKVGARDESDLNKTLEQDLGHSHKTAKKISTLPNGHHVYEYKNVHGGIAYYVLHPKTKKTMVKITGYKEPSGEFGIGWASRHSSYPGKVHDVYKHLAVHHGMTLRSDTGHSLGSFNTYKTLSQDPDLEVTRKTFEGQPLKMYTGDDFHKNYGSGNTDSSSQFYVRAKKK